MRTCGCTDSQYNCKMMSVYGKKITMKKLCILLLLVSFAPAAVFGGWLPERTGPDSVPCDLETDFKEVFLLRNWQKLPHKNQEESQARVNEVNSIIKKGKWSYVKLLPVLACLSFAASTIADWWAMEYGWEQGSYENFYNGYQEEGFNPRELEVVYLKRAKENWFKYPIVQIPDRVHKKPFPASNPGFARLLTDQPEGTIQDPILPGISYSYTKGKYPIESKWLRVRRKLKSNERFTKELVKLLHSHGPMLTQIEFRKLIRAIMPGVHGVVIIGYGKPKANPDETVFIIQDSYGDHPKDYGIQVEGGPSYKFIKAKYLQSVVVFPHKPKIEVTQIGENYSLRILNRARKPLKVSKLAVWDAEKGEAVDIEANAKGSFILKPYLFASNDPGYIDIYVAAEYYMQSPEKGYWFKFKVR